MIFDRMGVKLGLCYNYGLKYLTRFVWYAICGVLFWRTYVRFKDGPEYVYLHQILGSWLCVARGSAAVINLNCAIILLPMCQSLLRMIYFSARQMNIDTRWYTINTKAFHIFIGYFLLQMTAVHVIAHAFNAKSFCDNFLTEFPDVNPLPKDQTSFYKIVFGTVTGVTGVLLLLTLLVLFLTSLHFVRRRSFNVFWYSHRLFILFYVLLVVHGHKGLLRKQMNTEFHRPGCLQETGNISSPRSASLDTGNTDNVTFELHGNVSTVTCSAPPEFGHIGCQTWIWMCVPLLLYVCDMVCRMFRRSKSVEISEVKSVCNDVIEVSLVVNDMRLAAGQYVFINCSVVSTLEWHPFSIVQVPSKDNGHTLKLWIKSSGDWTERFASRVMSMVQVSFSEGNSSVSYLEVKVDGPYCSTMQQISQYKVAVCIAGGVGVTPFISHLIHLAEQSTKRKIQFIHIICTTRDEKFLTNAASVVRQCIDKLINKVTVQLDVYYTGESEDLKNNQNIQPTGTFKKGRPAFHDIFTDIRNQHKRKTIGVFACGPPGICKAVRKQCHEQTGLNTKFVFYKETF